MAQLLKHAMKEKAPQGRLEKYVFISESTLPAKPWVTVHRALSASENSDFCIPQVSEWPKANVNGRQLTFVKHHQWVVLNRKHSEIFAKQWYEEKWKKWAHLGADVYSRGYNPSFCADEMAIFLTIFGSWPQHTP